MERALDIRYKRNGENITKRALVRYADDFVVFTESKEDAEYVRDNILTLWLAKRGLVLSPEKTRIAHLTEGFDFLGFTVKHYEDDTRASGWKLLIRPSKK
jgi:RNA-directed DNA polymerase